MNSSRRDESPYFQMRSASSETSGLDCIYTVPFRCLEFALGGSGLLVWIGDCNLVLCRGLHWAWQWVGRCVRTHNDPFLIHHACPGHSPGLLHLPLVITLSCPNTTFLSGDSLRAFVICLGGERVLALFPVIRSSFLGIEPVFLHPSGIFLSLGGKKMSDTYQK